MPKVSVIMPAYNAERYIKEAVDSILGQTFQDFELIILNDCSKDSTEQIILSYQDPRIVYVKNEVNMGVAATLNRGLHVAKGEYIARMDADDISLPGRLDKQVRFLDEHEKVAVVGTSLERFGEEIDTQRRTFSSDAGQMKVDLLFSCGLAHPSVMMRRNVILRLNGYDLEYEGLEDYELWCRVVEQYEVTVLPELLFRYRVHGKQVTKNPSEKYITRMYSLKKRQLETLRLPTQGAMAESFYDYCLGKVPSTHCECTALLQFLQSVLDVNRESNYYNHNCLESTFKAVAFNITAKLPFKEAVALCEETSLLNSCDIVVQKMKRSIKYLLGKQ